MKQQVLRVYHESSPEAGEDGFAFRRSEQGSFLCVTDGCGGLGSRRYAALQNHTGAYAAARIAARCFEEWSKEGFCLPVSQEECEQSSRALEHLMSHRLQAFARQYCEQEKSRITGSMQRTLPATLCAVAQCGMDACFWWAGDSRGYVLDRDGLRQYTRDHIRGSADAFDALYLDAPLSNMLSADRPGMIQCRHVKLRHPCVIMAATDGIYSSLATPMEVEMLLLDTLQASRNMAEWEKQLSRRISGIAQDDATLLLMPVGFEDFDQLRAQLKERRTVLQKQFITPVRRHKGDLAFAKEKWLQYKPTYDCTEAQNE